MAAWGWRWLRRDSGVRVGPRRTIEISPGPSREESISSSFLSHAAGVAVSRPDGQAWTLPLDAREVRRPVAEDDEGQYLECKPAKERGTFYVVLSAA